MATRIPVGPLIHAFPATPRTPSIQPSNDASLSVTRPSSCEDFFNGLLGYVPIYSSIFYENGKSTLELAATLSIHNVNPDRQLTIVRPDYYDTAGKLIRKHFDKPLILNPLETKNVVIDRTNTAGGTGANFLVEWQSQESVISPLVEAVMVNASSNLGIAFTTAGKVIRQTTLAPN